jgi:hypothetical protein
MPTLTRIGNITDSNVPGVRIFAQNALDNLLCAHDAVIASRITQTYQANKRRRDESSSSKFPFKEGDLTYLLTQNLALPKGRARKLLPKYIGPYKILKTTQDNSTVNLELSDELKARGIHPTFHTSLLKPFVANDDTLFPHRDPKLFYDFGLPDDTEWVVDEINAHKWTGNRIDFQVKWSLGDTTWESYNNCKDLKALDDYLALIGVDSWRKLPRKNPR